MVASSVPTISASPTSSSVGSAAGSNGNGGAANATGVVPANATTSGASQAAAAATNVAADAGVATDFVSMLTQLLNTDTATSTEAGVTAVEGELKETKDSGEDADLAADASGTESPLVADISQIIGMAQGLRDSASTKQDAATDAAIASAKTALPRALAKDLQANADVQFASQDDAAQVAKETAFTLSNATSSDGSTNDSRGRDNAKSDATPQVNSNNTVAIDNKPNNESRFHSQLQERVGTPAWREEVGAKLHWMIERGVQTGSLRLSPEHLGPMEVKISVQNDQVSVWFGAAHADTRSALENALPRLREMLATQGMSLADAGVFREPPRDPQQGRPQEAQGYGAANGEGGDATTGVVSIARRPGLLDAYA